MAISWTLDELVESYASRSAANVTSTGIEWERSGIYRDTGRPVPYVGDQGYLAILKKLVAEVGWEVMAEEEGCGILELQRGITRVTIEGDGRLELSGSPQSNLHDLAREFRIHVNEVAEMGNIFAIGWLPLGFQPLHNDDEIQYAPRERYRVFQRFGDAKLMEMDMKRTNGLTANVGYQDEKSAVRMAQTAFRVLPVVGAMFASSPLDAGLPGKYLNTRRWCIQNYFPERTFIPENILDPDFTLRSWVDHYVHLPVLLTKRGNVTRGVQEQITFLDWMQKGMNGEYPAMEDFDVHVKTTWSDLRLRPTYLEYRVADSVPLHLALALPALMKGLLLDPENWDRIEQMTLKCTYEDILLADKHAWDQGLKAKLNGQTLLSLAQDLLKMANESLHAFKQQDGSGQDETIFLAPLKEYIYIKERSPADEILRHWETDWSRNFTNLLKWCEEN